MSFCIETSFTLSFSHFEGVAANSVVRNTFNDRQYRKRKRKYWYFIQSKEHIESKQSAAVKKHKNAFCFHFFNNENNRINIDTGIKKAEIII